MQNDDGTWVRLSTESIRQHVVTTWFPTEAWCLQFNTHLNRTLLFPVHDPDLELPPDDDEDEDGQDNDDDHDGTVPDVNCSQGLNAPAAMVSNNVRAGECVSQGSNPFLNMQSFSQDETEDKSNDELLHSKTTDAAPSNLGNTIAVVVEEGANKIQALHKWLRGDSVDLKTGIRRRLESSGCIDGSENRSSLELGEAAPSSMPQSPSLLQQQRFEYGNGAPTDTDGRSPTKKRNTFLISSTPTVAETSKQSHRTKLSNLSRPTHQLSNDTASTIGSRTGSFEEPVGVLKRALPPTLAESLRAMFAAFLWQEDIVHDAMACASFLKFHPLLPKNLGQICDGMVPEDCVDTRILMTK